MANKEMKTIQFPGSEIVYEIVDNAAREALAGKQPTGDYATKTELTEGLAGKQPTGDYATVEQLNQGLDGKQPTGDYATRTELSQGLAEKQPAGDYATTEELNAGLELKQPIGDYVTRQKLDEDLAKKQPVGDYVTNDELTSGLAEKQPIGDYATNTALTEGLAGKQPMGDYATNTALAEGLAQKQPTGDYALKSELPDVSAFITKSVNDLVNYYTKTEVDNKISTIPKFSIKVVDILPFDSISTTTIYLLKTPSGTNGDLYTEYIYVDGAWETLGTQTVDLSGYVTTEALNSAIADFVTAEYVSTALAKYATTESLNAHTGNTNNPHSVTKTQVGLENVANERQYSSQNPPPYPVQSVAGKTGIVTLNKSDVQLGNVDNTADMDKPVSTAQSAAINAKYTKPASGIPKTDLAADMQTSLGKADSAYQKPSTGIPKADLSEEVQNALETAAQGAPDATTTIKGIMTLGADGGAARYGEKSDVGLENVDNVKQYSASNPPPYPVTSVAGRTGAVTLTKADVGLSNVDNTSDTAKPVSTAQATAIAEAKQAGTNAQNAIDTHAGNTSNPHNVTAAQVGAYVKPAEGIPETDLSAEVQEKLNSSGGGGGATAENLLQSSVTANRQAGIAEGDMVNLGYALGLEEGKQYTVKYKFNDADIVATAKYEAPTGLPLEGGELCLCQSVSAEGMNMTFPMLLGVSPYNASVEDYQTAAMSYGYLFIVDKHQITGDMTYSDDENNSSVYVRVLQTSNAQNAVNVEITAIEPFAEVVADKVKNPLTIGDVVFDGSAAKTVDLSEYAKTTGTYSDMTAGNAEKLGNKAASEYALASDIPDVSNTKPRIYSTKKSVYPYKWVAKTWQGLTSFNSNGIWTDGNDIYYSNISIHYVLNRETSTWESKTWNGLTSFIGSFIWTDGENIYCSNREIQYVLTRKSSTWVAKTWQGLTSFNGQNIWTDGENIYYSDDTDQYVLNRETSTWESKTWNGLTSFNGQNIWTDGENIYYSNQADQYVLNRETSTWESKTWNGLTSFYGSSTWTDGENIYLSSVSSHHSVLNRETSTWESKTWDGLTSFYGSSTWTDGENIYYSNRANQYKLTKAIPTTKTTLRR